MRYNGWYNRGMGKTVARPRIPALVKQRILVNQGGLCLYCLNPFGSFYRNGKTDEVQILQLTWDHMVPYEYTRAHKETNLAAACHLCNRFKTNKMFETVDEARVYLKAVWEKRRLEVVSLGAITGRHHPNSCALCGKPLIRHRPWQVYCTTNCRVKAWNRKHPRTKVDAL